MGVVYKAEDTKLERTVALKFLASHLLEDEEGRARFIREAKAAASLDHQNICTVYEIDEDEGQTFIAMAFIEGQTVKEKIADRPLKLDEALDIAIQTAAGLQAAHEKGVVHRDIKSTNLMVTPQGQVKIMDFGLAQLAERSKLTKTESMLGTPAYMSPEQAQRLPTDRRTDIWSLGVVIYEMVTGRLPFEGEREQAVLYSIVQEDQEPITALRVGVPTELDRIVGKAMAKSGDERYQHIDELLVDLRLLQRQLAPLAADVRRRQHATLSAASPRMPRPGWRIAVAAVMLLLVAALAIWYSRRSVDTWENPLAGAKFTRLTNFEGTELDAAISADGKLVAFLADRNGPFDAWVGQIGGGDFVNLTQGRFSELLNPRTRNAVFSADGSHIWLRISVTNVRLPNVWLFPTLGGPPRPFLESSAAVAWSSDGERIAYHKATPGDPIFVADRTGGNPKKLFTREQDLGHCHHPTWSPDGRFIYFTSGFPPNNMDVWRVPSGGGAAERITRHNSTVGYPNLLDNRTLIYTATAEDGAGSCLYAMDVERRIPHRVSAGIEQYISVAADAATSGRSRRLVATLSNTAGNLWSVPISGGIADETVTRPVQVPSARATGPRLGPDYLLYLSSTGPADGLWKSSNGAATELWKASEGGLTASPALSPDGDEICFSYRRKDKAALYLMSADGTNVRLLTDAFQVRGAPSWSPDGEWIVVGGDEGTGSRIFKVPADGGTPVRLVENPVVSQFDSYFRGPFGPGLAGFGARASTNPTIHSASCSWVVRPAAIAGVMRSVL